MRIIDLGELSGAILVYGGPYSNAEAMAALKAEAERRAVPPERRICTGDIVGYCADPAATIALVRRAGGAVVAGNCERQIAAGAVDCGCGFAAGTSCDALSRGWYPHATACVARHERKWMAGLPDAIVFSAFGRRHAVIHGGATNIARFIWVTSPAATFAEEVACIEARTGPVDVVFAGHSGIAFQRRVAGVLWVNAGALGLPPHDGRRETRYAMLSQSGVRIERLTYDAEAAAERMRTAGLVQGYERTLLAGLWPSEDVLPAALRRATLSPVPADDVPAPAP